MAQDKEAVTPGAESVTEIPRGMFHGLDDSFDLLRHLHLVDTENFEGGLLQIVRGIETVRYLRAAGLHLMPIPVGEGIAIFELERGARLDEGVPEIKTNSPARVFRVDYNKPIKFDENGALTFEGHTSVLAGRREKAMIAGSEPALFNIQPDRVTLEVAGQKVINNVVDPQYLA